MSQDTTWPAIQAKLRLDVGIRLQVPVLLSLAQVKRETGARFLQYLCCPRNGKRCWRISKPL